MTEYLKFLGSGIQTFLAVSNFLPGMVCVWYGGNTLSKYLHPLRHFCLRLIFLKASLSLLCYDAVILLNSVQICRKTFFFLAFFKFCLSCCSKCCTLQFVCYLKVSNILSYWWKWLTNLVLKIEQRIPKARETFKQTLCFNWFDWACESICLASDNDKAGGKHCTIWAVTACDFTSERKLLYSPAKSNGVYSSPATDQLDQLVLCSKHVVIRVTNWLHLDVLTVVCLTKSLSAIHSVCCLLLVFL